MDTSTMFDATVAGVNGAIGKLTVRAEYDSTKPYEVKFGFQDPGKTVDAATWTFGRDILREGLLKTAEKPAGHGDVKCGMSGKDVLLMLSSPFGTAEIAFQLRDMQIFVNNIYVIVPEGSEGVEEDLDAELAKLLEDK